MLTTTTIIIIMNFVGLGNNAWKPIQGTDIRKDLKKCQTDGTDVSSANGKGRVWKYVKKSDNCF